MQCEDDSDEYDPGYAQKNFTLTLEDANEAPTRIYTVPDRVAIDEHNKPG